MMLALLLAQIVLPWPGLDSPLVQPGPTICVGECAGPVIYGPAERGRLVVACDMTSDTCSDGRRITTERATPVPCETSPGVWEMVPEDTGCYSVRGLESWAATTSYLAYGAELDREPWTVDAQASIAALPGGGYRVCHIDPVAGNHGLRQLLGGARPETLTVAAIARANTAPSALIGAWSQFETLTLPASWDLIAATKQTASGASGQTFFYPRPAGQGRCMDLLAAWLTHTSTPGRACWGGEAPVTCAADNHTISTEGWPREAGEVEIVFHYYGQAAARPERLIDGRSIGDLEHYTLFISSTTGFPLTLSLNATPIVQSSSLSWESGKVYRVRLRRTLDGEIELFRDGVRVAAASGPPLSWSPLAALGARYDFIEGQRLNGSISSLRIRSFE